MMFFEKILDTLEESKLPDNGDPGAIISIFKEMINTYFKKNSVNINISIIKTLYDWQDRREHIDVTRQSESNFNRSLKLFNKIFKVSEDNLTDDYFYSTFYTKYTQEHPGKKLQSSPFKFIKNSTEYSEYYQKIKQLSELVFSDFKLDEYYKTNIILHLFGNKADDLHNLIDNIINNDDIIILYNSTDHISSFYSHKNSDESYEFYYINSNLEKTIHKSHYTDIKRIITAFSRYFIFQDKIIGEKFFFTPLDEELYLFEPFNEITLSDVQQQHGTCFLYSSLLTISLLLYKNFNTITYKLQDEFLPLQKPYFEINNDQSYILYKKQIPQIFQLFFYYAYDMFIKIVSTNLSTKNKELTYNNFIYASLNNVYYSYHTFYNRNKLYDIFNNKLITPKEYVEYLNDIYQKIIKSYSLNNEVNIHINTKENKQEKLIINNINEFENFNEKTMFWHYPQEYKFMHDNIYNLINDFDKIDIKNLYLGNFNDLFEKSPTEYNNVYYYKNRRVVKFTNYNIFIPFGYTYDQFIDIKLMEHSKAYSVDEEKILTYEDIKNKIFEEFELDKKDYNKNYNTIQKLYNTIEKSDVKNIINNIYEFRKLFIHRYLSLFNFLNIKLDNNSFNLIEEFLILNFLATFYMYYILDKIITFSGSSFNYNLC